VLPLISSADSAFRVCQISFEVLLELQLESEARGWATRWTAAHALRSQVKEESVLLQTLMREERAGPCGLHRPGARRDLPPKD
jgi:hypothetical protein